MNPVTQVTCDVEGYLIEPEHRGESVACRLASRETIKPLIVAFRYYFLWIVPQRQGNVCRFTSYLEGGTDG